MHVHIQIIAEIPPAHLFWVYLPDPHPMCRQGDAAEPGSGWAGAPPAPHFTSRSTQGQQLLSLPSSSAMISAFQERLGFVFGELAPDE